MYEAVVMGVSAGGFEALKTIIPALPKSFPAPVAIVQHMAENSGTYLVDFLASISAVKVQEAEDKGVLEPGCVYIAPPGYHLLIEKERSFSLSVDGRVNYSCPSVDVLFESAADIYRHALIGVVLTGANGDGSAGIRAVKDYGGIAIVQNPETAHMSYMPRSALQAVQADYVADLEDIAPLLVHLVQHPGRFRHVAGKRG